MKPKNEINLELMKRALDSSSCAVSIADAGMHDLPLIYVNKAFERITGYTHKEVLGKNCRFLQGAATRPADVKKIKQALKLKRECEVVLQNYRKDGVAFWNELYISPVFNEKKQLTHFIGVQTDVTARVRAENELKQHKSQLEEIVEERTRKIGDKNVALKEVLGQLEVEKRELKKNAAANIEHLILPMIKKLRKMKDLKAQSRYLEILEKNIEDLSESFGVNISKKLHRLSPREIEIADMIRKGLSTKDIAELLNISMDTVENQRNSIRKKLEISRKKVNLTSFLQAL